MRSKNLVYALVVVSLIIACSKPAPPEQPSPQRQAVQDQNNPLANIKSSSFSDIENWQNGISRKNTSIFFLKILQGVPAPVTVGGQLKFQHTGLVEVLKVSPLVKSDGTALFITVSKPLDPIKDGYPNFIEIFSSAILPGVYSDDVTWKNGINLIEKRSFFTPINPLAPPAIEVGDRLLFAGSGEMLVEKVYKNNKENNPKWVIWVSKELNPLTDGYPHPIRIMLTK